MEKRSILCCLPSVNRMTEGFRAGEMAVIASRPSISKAAFALKLAEGMAFESGERANTWYYAPEKSDILSADFGSGFRNFIEKKSIDVVFIDCTVLDTLESGKGRGAIGDVLRTLKHVAQSLKIVVNFFQKN